MTVYILYAEYQDGEGGPLSVHQTKRSAARARRAEVIKAHATGWIVWPERDEDPDWKVTLTVEAFEVQP